MTVSHGVIMDKKRTTSQISVTFWDRVCSMPFIKSSTNVYVKSKQKSAIVGAGLDVLESSVRFASAPVKSVASSVAAAYPNKASTLDALAHDCLDKLEDRCPVFQHQATEFVEGAYYNASKTLKCGVRSVLKSYPGQKVLQGLNSSIDVAEKILESVEDVGVEGRRSCSKGTQMSPGDIGGSGDGGSTLLKQKKRLSQMDKICGKKSSSVVNMQVMKYPITLPLRVWIYVLKSIKRTLVAVAGKKHRSTTALLSPDRLAEIRNRKTVSPKKRVPTTSSLQGLFDTVIRPVKVLCNMPSAKKDISLHIEPTLKVKGINEERHTEKRKHSDLEDEIDDDFSSTEDTDEDIYGLDDYYSSEDSDFKPHNASTDSLEYASGDTESDIEIEEVGKSKKTGSPLKQIRKTPKANKTSKPGKSDLRDNNQNTEVKGDKMPVIMEISNFSKKQENVGIDKNKEQIHKA